MNIPRGGRYVVVAYGDGTIRWLRLSDGEEVLALFVNTETREWVLWTPQGYYASSVAGDQNIGWQLNKGWEQAGEFVTAAQLKKHFYRPDVIKRAFDLADAGTAVREAGLSGFKLADLTNHTPPKFRIADPGDKSRADRSPVPVKIELAATDDPVTGFDVTVNGRQVTPRAVRDLPLTTNPKFAPSTFRLRRARTTFRSRPTTGSETPSRTCSSISTARVSSTRRASCSFSPLASTNTQSSTRYTGCTMRRPTRASCLTR